MHLSKEDDDILTYLDDDGQLIEPIFYAPIIPMILVNGTDGIVQDLVVKYCRIIQLKLLIGLNRD